jgi:hypothetical protein
MREGFITPGVFYLSNRFMNLLLQGHFDRDET